MNRGVMIKNCVEDMDSFLDAEMFSPFSSNNSSTTNLNKHSTSSVQPSYPYDMFTQTVPPTASDFYPAFSSAGSSSVTMSPDLLDLDLDLSSMAPPFFFPELTIDPSSTVLGSNDDIDYKQSIIPQPPPAYDGKRLYAGIHTQRAAYEKEQRARKAAQQQQQQQQQKQAATASPETKGFAQFSRESSAGSSMSTELSSIDERIESLFSQMKAPKERGVAGSPGSQLPHITRMKKDEEEMDEDERLLASEEGKKLSSKERRQLRNKVSARAFRSRRKEYIGQLEAEVANKNAENGDLKAENQSLKSEIAQLQELTRNMLRSPAFSQYLQDIQVAPPNNVSNNNSSKANMNATSETTPNLRKDLNPNMIGDWDLSYHIPVAGTPMWATNTPQVFSVLDLPSGPPSIQDLSGKAVRSEETVFDWSQFPPPVDGFSPRRQSEMAMPTAQKEPELEYESATITAIRYAAPEYLADLYDAKSSAPISETIEKIAPGVGLDNLLTRLEMVITGEADVAQVFEEASVQSGSGDVDAHMANTSDTAAPETSTRCRDVAMMFDTLKAYSRVGSICEL